jgi:hypothetical protein
MLPIYLRCVRIGRLDLGQGAYHCSDPTNAEIVRKDHEAIPCGFGHAVAGWTIFHLLPKENTCKMKINRVVT